MGPPRTRRARSVNPSRFHEGSMNDRVSNKPPVHFLGPEERAELERPVTRSQSRPVSDDWSEKQVKRGRLLGQVWDEVRGRLGFRRDGEEGSRRRERSRKGDGEEGRRERSRLRSRSRGRDRSQSRNRNGEENVKRDKDEGTNKEKDEKTREARLKEEAQKTDMPTREEILANYHHLVATGFFTSHAIQSTRQPPPGTTPANSSATSSKTLFKATPSKAVPSRTELPRAAPSRATPSRATPAKASSKAVPKIQADGLKVPQAPLRSTTPQPSPRRGLTPSPRPRSSGARSPSPTKKKGPEPHAATYDQLVESGFFTPPVHPLFRGASPAPGWSAPIAPAHAAPAPVVYSTRSSKDYLQPPTPKWTSRTGTPSPSRAPSPMLSTGSVSSRGTKRAAIEIPVDDENEENNTHDPPTPNKKLRKTASRDIAVPKLRNVASRRAMAPRRSVSGPDTNNSREYNNLARRVLGRLPGANARNNADTSDRAKPALRRSASGGSKAPLHENNYSKVLRSRRSAKDVLRSGQNGNRVPQVPAIPQKFVSCEDRENGAPYLTLQL